MTPDSKQQEAFSLFQDGEYEKAIEAMSQSETIGDNEFKSFLSQCKSCLVEQYKFLIAEAVENGDQEGAVQYKKEFVSKFGEHPEIVGVGIDTPVKDTTVEQEGTVKPSTIYLIFAGVFLALILFTVLVSKCSTNNSEHYYSAEECVVDSISTTAEETCDTESEYVQLTNEDVYYE